MGESRGFGDTDVDGDGRNWRLQEDDNGEEFWQYRRQRPDGTTEWVTEDDDWEHEVAGADGEGPIVAREPWT